MGVVARCDQDGVSSAEPPRLAFLDGLRGLTAAYVVLHHAALLVPPTGLNGLASAIRFLFRHGHYAVSAFVVFSGYGLMLRAATRPEGRLPCEILGYLGRRAKRILPPYYAALGICWLLAATVPTLGRPGSTPWDRALPAFEPGVVVSHLLLMHNLSGRWIFRVAPPLWSLATEWQVYLLFPVLLTVWRRLGTCATVATGFALGSFAAALAGPLGNPALRALCPWYLGLFALGMAAAVADRAPHARNRPVTALLVMVAIVLTVLAVATGDDRAIVLTDGLAGVVAARLLVRCARASTRADADPTSPSSRPFGLRLLESRGLVALGACSYSLYLTHYPALALTHLTLKGWSCGPEARLAALLLVASPACVPLAIVFRHVFERPCSVGRVGSNVIVKQRSGPPRRSGPHATPAVALR